MFRVFSLAFLFWISAFHSIAATIPPMDKRLSNLNYPFAVDTYLSRQSVRHGLYVFAAERK